MMIVELSVALIGIDPDSFEFILQRRGNTPRKSTEEAEHVDVRLFLINNDPSVHNVFDRG